MTNKVKRFQRERKWRFPLGPLAVAHRQDEIPYCGLWFSAAFRRCRRNCREAPHFLHGVLRISVPSGALHGRRHH